MGLESIQIWAVLMAGLLLIEVLTVNLTTIWFAAGALAALICALLNLPLWVQITVFVVVSVVTLFFTKPFAEKMRKKVVPTNADSLIGQEAIVTKRIDNIRGTGEVKINGQYWTARSVNPEHTIDRDEIVMVRAIEGVKLIVGKRIDEAADKAES